MCNFSVVIPTYNRPTYVRRAIDSVVRQGRDDVEIIVCDDCSRVPVAELLLGDFPTVRFLRTKANSGPGHARDLGIHNSTATWVLTLDDDDELLPNAFTTIAAALSRSADALSFPLLQFPRSNAMVPSQYQLLRLTDYLNGTVSGDFTHLVNRKLFLSLGLSYPKTRLGAESLLMWDLANRFGIPTWNSVVSIVHTDAPTRLTHVSSQIAKASEFAELQELILCRFGNILEVDFPKAYTQKRLGAAAYRLLSGDRYAALRHLDAARPHLSFAIWATAQLIVHLPTFCVRALFLFYRWAVERSFRMKMRNPTPSLLLSLVSRPLYELTRRVA